MTDITRFKAIFSGLDIAYGTYKIKSERGDGKQAGQATVVRKPPTDDLWIKHLEGVDPSLGIIPIRADNTCIWGCIDIDQYPLDHKGLVDKVRSLSLPLVVCRSKSGGAHVFLFSKEPNRLSCQRLGHRSSARSQANRHISSAAHNVSISSFYR